MLRSRSSAARGDHPLQVLLDTAITYEVVGGAVHSPMVHVKVGGTMTKLILDSGSTDHVLTIELATRAGLESKPGEPGTDHAGAPVPSRALGDVAVEIEGCALNLRTALAIKGPAPFEGWDVGGFLSPQNLHPSAFVVLDLFENRLYLVEGDTPSVLRWLEERFPALRVLSLERERGPVPLVQAAVEPFGSVAAMLNTGSSGTEFARRAVPTLRGTPPEITGLGVSGAEVHGEEVKGQTLRVGGGTLPVPVLLARERMPPEHPDGIVGMDVLRGTVLAVGAEQDQPVLWLVPLPADQSRPS